MVGEWVGCVQQGEGVTNILGARGANGFESVGIVMQMIYIYAVDTSSVGP